MNHNFTSSLYSAYQEIPRQPVIYFHGTDKQETYLDYKTLFEESCKIADNLISSGIKKGEVVILILDRLEQLVPSFFGSIFAGAVPSIMPYLTEKLDPDHYFKSIDSLIQITKPTAIITYESFGEHFNSTDENSSVRKVLLIEDLIAEEGPPEPEFIKTLPGLEQPSSSIVLLQHSSGTTGLQKGVALSHQAVFNQIKSYSQALLVNRGDKIVSWLPLYHDMGLIAGFILPVLMRIPLILISPFDWVKAPYKLFQAISEHQATLCWMPNFAYNFCAQKIRERNLTDVRLDSLRAIINCSEPMYAQSHQMFYEKFAVYGFREDALATSYAMAENVFAVTQGGINSPVRVDTIDLSSFQTGNQAIPIILDDDKEPDPDTSNLESKQMHVVSAGKPISGTKIKIIDDQGQELEDRQIGEIAIQSNCLLKEYYRRPEITRDSFKDGWYLTGDLGYLAEKELYVTGRKKDLIIVGGKNIYPQDLESAASEVDGIHPGRVAAFGVYNQRSGTEDAVIVAEMDDHSADQTGVLRQSIIEDVRKNVTRKSDIALRYIQLVDRNWLIKTSSGKVSRHANRERYIQEFL